MKAEVIARRLGELSIPLPEGGADKLCRYHEMLMDYNTRIDLTAVTEEDEMLDRHYSDSLAVLKLDGVIQKGASLIDVGTGAGFPGLPLAIARPDLKVTLLDALQKRVAFLDDVAAALKLENVTCLHMRAEDAAHNPLYRERFDIAVARAVASLPVLLEYTLPFVKIGGQALLWKGPAVLDEMRDGLPVAHILGGKLHEPIPTPILGRDWQHFIVPIQKSSATIRQYPRKAGTPQKQPLHIKLK